MDYFPLDTDFFGDIKIKRLLDSFGSKGVATYLYVLCAAYRGNGYYVKCDDNLVYSIAHELQIKDNAVTGIIYLCAKLGLFDQTCFETEGILTSCGLQKRYMQICKQRKSKRVISEYALVLPAANAEDDHNVFQELMAINAEENQKVIPQNIAVIPGKTTVMSEQTLTFSEQMRQKKNEKEKEEEKKKKPADTFPTTPTTDFSVLPNYQQLIPVDTLIDEFKSECMFRDYCQMQNSLSADDLDGYFERFRLFLHATDEHQKRRKDCKTHFLNWLRIQLAQDRKPTENEPADAEEPTERQIARVRQLYPENNCYSETLYRNYIREHRLSPETALDHFERAHKQGLTYGKVIFKVQVDHALLFKN